ncbi:hypothetical protein LCGC14_0408830 [marine sediment metagenome]|uniref:Uncharacterized protein n=1 Tax=marine sediment metagenome TaxID=412755 RepID=A0A0F9VGJ6_9ZZZZ
MSKSTRAQRRRSKRSNLSKSKRDEMASQHFNERKARLSSTPAPTDNDRLGEPAPGAIEKIMEAVKPVSSARRAFQDV